MERALLRALGILLIAFTAASGAIAAEGSLEEIVVTGSYIKGTPEDAALPVDVLRREELEDVGSPSIVEMVRNLGVSQGLIGETNQFDTRGGQGNEGVATINLRGLGSARTLVLLNGKRHVTTETVGVDISAIPSAAVGRFEVLKDGAAALYGSDAIAGVVNVITRSGFEGLELRGSFQDIEDSDGDYNASAVYGWANDRLNFLVTGEYDRRSELPVKERDWALLPREQNLEGGYSAISNPARFLPAHPLAASPPNPAGLLGAGAPDPNCELLGAPALQPTDPGGPACFFQYSYFDNLVEETDTYKIYSELNFDLNEAATLHLEALYSEVDMEAWKSSPSYPPQSLFGPDRFVAPTHPGLIDMKAQNPTMFSDVGPFPAAAQGAFLVSRMLGVEGRPGGNPEEGERNTETWRFGGGLSGAAFDGQLNYDISAYYSKRDRLLTVTDMYVERMAFALDGLGGAGCDPATGTPGVGPCEFYNPFSNAIERSAVNGAVNPQFNPAVANSDALIDWLTADTGFETTNELLVWDAVISGETGWELPGGNIGWAAGFQARNEKYDIEIPEVSDRTLHPCPFEDPTSVVLGNTPTLDCGIGTTGLLAFLGPSQPESTSRTVYGLFGELAIPVTDTIDMQAAVRFEDYGGDVGSTVDPKIALRWQATEWLALRGSGSTTFRGPPQSFLTGTNTALVFIAPTNAFKAVDIVGNPSLEPETATGFNFGFIVDTGNFYGSLDWWSFDFEDPFQTESSSQIVTAYIAQQCEDGGAGAATAECQNLRSHVFPLGTPAAALQRVEVNFINGADQETSGIDWFAQYDFNDVLGGELSLGTDGTYTAEYKSDDFTDINGQTLATGGDFIGLLNDDVPLLPKPEIKGSVWAKFSLGAHRVTYALRYVHDYEDANPAATVLPSLHDIDSHVTHDLHYIVRLFDDRAVVSLSAINLTDEDPPQVSADLNYDPYTHSPFGRMLKLGLTYNLF